VAGGGDGWALGGVVLRQAGAAQSGSEVHP